MARKQTWTVRVILPQQSKRLPDQISGLWLEQLRYMGHAKVLHENDDIKVVEFYCPDRLLTDVWAGQNAGRMQSFGINAVAAPMWSDDLLTRPFGEPPNSLGHMTRMHWKVQ